MGEDMTYGGVDWVAVMFHAAREVGAENRRLRAENAGLTGQVERQAKRVEPIVRLAFAEMDGSGCGEPNIEKFIEKLILDHAGMSSIRKMYEEHPYASSRSLGMVIEEMVKLWEDDNTPF